jgi:GNAT superfamily N-acetyltransferase
MKRLAAGKRSPGIIAYVDGRPAGWCAAAPRETYLRLARSRVLRPLDDKPVWSVSCFFIAKEFRRQGLSVLLLHAVADWARANGAEVLEGYPVIPYAADMPAAFAWTGLLDSYLRAGFKEMPRWSKARPIVRFDLATGRRGRRK